MNEFKADSVYAFRLSPKFLGDIFFICCGPSQNKKCLFSVSLSPTKLYSTQVKRDIKFLQRIPSTAAYESRTKLFYDQYWRPNKHILMKAYM